jgi:hypothetical protein
VIKQENGRFRSVRLLEEDMQLGVDEYSLLTDDEKKAFDALLTFVQTGDTDLIDDLYKIDYEKTPVGVEEFLRNDYFLGGSGKNLYPILMDDMVELFEGDYYEAILTGAIGYGKSFFCSLALLYMLYQMSCMRNPQSVYGVDQGSTITLSILSVNQKTARRVILSEIIGKLENSPYFQEEFPYKAKFTEINFLKSPISIIAGSTTNNAILGMNIFGGIVDEANFLGEVRTIQRKTSQVRWGHISKAEVVYSAIVRRMKSRYMRSGKLPGILFLPSSKSSISSFTDSRIKESINDPNIFVRDYATWDVKKTKVLVGNERIRSHILEEGEETKFKDTKEITIVDVPEDYRKDFERDVEGSIRDIAGISTFGISLFFQNISKIYDIFAMSERFNLVHPFSTLEWQIDKPGNFMWDKITKKVFKKLPGGFKEECFEPLINPEVSSHVRIDPSLTGDATGLAVGHIFDWKEVVRRDDRGREYNEIAPVIMLDFVLRILPPFGDEILLGDVRTLIYQMMEHGYNISYASADQYQSADSMQKLRQRGIKSEVFSVDSNIQSYQTLKVAIYEDRLICYNYPILVEELKRLEFDMNSGKVDHPQNGCFVGETRVPLGNGKVVTMEEIESEKELFYCIRDDGLIMISDGICVLSKFADELLEVSLTNGYVERCTLDHLWMLLDGNYKRAIDLKIGDRLKSSDETRIQSIKALKLLTFNKPIPVYDIKMDKIHNFGLASGVFVHNSKDVSDAVAGLVFSLSQKGDMATLSPRKFSRSKHENKDDSWVIDGWKSTKQKERVEPGLPLMPFITR